MTASLFESNDSATQFLRDTLNSRNSVMSIELGPLQSLDGLLGDDLKSSPRSSSTENDNNNQNADGEYTIELKAPSSNGSSPRVVEVPLQPTKVTRSASEAERFVNKMKALLQVKQPDRTNSNGNAASSLPPMPSPMAANRKRSLSEMTVDSMIWNNLGSGSVEQVNYEDIFRTQESVKPVAVEQPTAQPSLRPKAAVLVTTATERVYVIPTENDVLCGKGGRTNNNPANKRYLRLKDAMQARYLVAEKAEKKEISQALVDTVNKEWKGRFLKKETTSNKDERWYELDNEAARKKCSQALRELNTPEKRAEKRARYAK